MPTWPVPTPAHLPKSETKRLALGLILSNQGWASEQVSQILGQITALQREAECRRLSYVPSADANDFGGTAAKVEALVSHANQ